MSTPATVPIFDPQGVLRDVPYEQMTTAVQAGGKPAVRFQAPDNSVRFVPADQTQDAVKAGGSILPIEQQDVKHPGFWSTLSDDLGSMASSALPKSIKDVAAMVVPGVGQYQMGERFNEEDQARKAEGRSTAYRVAAPVAEALTGVNARGMEQSANEGDVGGVLGHAAAPIAVTAATMGASEAAPAVADVGARAVRAGARGVNTALAKAPGTVGSSIGGVVGGAVGHATGIPGAGELGAGIGATAGGLVGKEVLPQVQIPGEGFGLPDRVTGGPKNAPPEAPAQIPGVNARPSLERITPEALNSDQPIPGVNVRPNIERIKSLMDLPIPAVNQAIKELGASAPIPSLTARANQIAKLAVEGAGGEVPTPKPTKPLEPNVPLKNQGRVAAKNPSNVGSSILEGHTPVDSSALSSYKYDPAAREVEIGTQGKNGYVYGDISPEQAEAFKSAESKGKAWADIKKNGTYVAKIIDGKRIAVNPVVSDEDLIPQDEWDAAHEIETQVEGTPRR